MIVLTNHCCYHQRRRRRLSPPKLLVPYLEPIPEEDATTSATSNSCSSNSSDDNSTPATSLLQLANRVRARRGVALLQESSYLNELAQRHAQRMADLGQVGHSVATVPELQQILGCGTVGENVQCGVSLSSMHWESLHDPSSLVNRRNVLAPYFDECGCAVAVSKVDGKLYTCQLFRTSVKDLTV